MLSMLAYPLPRAEEIAYFINHAAEALCGIKVIEAQGRITALLDAAMILLDGIVHTGNYLVLDLQP